jgi:hypothetical protein
MAMGYWRLKLKGERSADEVQSAVGRTGGNVVRIHVEDGNTQVYFAAEKSAIPAAVEALQAAGGPEEVSEDEITRLD